MDDSSCKPQHSNRSIVRDWAVGAGEIVQDALAVLDRGGDCRFHGNRVKRPSYYGDEPQHEVENQTTAKAIARDLRQQYRQQAKRVQLVMVQRDVETARSPLASITPFSASQFGTTSPNALAGGGTGSG